MADKNFDSLFERFEKKVYNSLKGDLRLALLRNDFYEFFPFLYKNNNLNVLDAGGGLGQLSLEIAKYNNVVFCDLSEKMVNKVKSGAASKKVENSMKFFNLPFQSLPDEYYSKFDVIIFHAVLEWLENPKDSFDRLLKFLKPGGYISVMFYNKESLILHNAIKGNFKKIFNEDFKGFPNSLTPQNPINSNDFIDYVKTKNLEIIQKSGIRCIYDYMRPDFKFDRSFEDVLKIEKKLYRTEPFSSLGRYIHLIMKIKL